MDVLAILKAHGGIFSGRHFVYSGGKHGPDFVTFDPLYLDPALVAKIAGNLAAPFAGEEIDTVAVPVGGSIVLGNVVALALSEATGRKVGFVWADKIPQSYIFRRVGFARHLSDSRVLIVDDMVTSGRTVRLVAGAVRAVGGKVVGASSVCNRGNITAADAGIPRLSVLSRLNIRTYLPGNCPLCSNDVPIIIDVGRGAAFLAEFPDYQGGSATLLTG